MPMLFCASCRQPFYAKPSAIKKGTTCCSLRCRFVRRGIDNTSIETRFWSYVDRSGGPHECWPWQGKISVKGYGIFTIQGRQLAAHRMAYEYTHGLLLPTFCACHTCDNRPCCNDNHLFAGHNYENAHDCTVKGRRWHPIGVLHPKALFRESDIRAIRLMLQTHTRADIARIYKVSWSTIDDIAKGEHWSHVV